MTSPVLNGGLRQPRGNRAGQGLSTADLGAYPVGCTYLTYLGRAQVHRILYLVTRQFPSTFVTFLCLFLSITTTFLRCRRQEKKRNHNLASSIQLL